MDLVWLLYKAINPKQHKMKWEKKGQLFDPAKYELYNDCKIFAQSPQALVFDDFVRIYFSTRKWDDAAKKYLSFIAFADFNKNLETVIRVSTAPVINLGGLGAFDEHGIFPINILKSPGSYTKSRLLL